jgi:hypothetical protein
LAGVKSLYESGAENTIVRPDATQTYPEYVATAVPPLGTTLRFAVPMNPVPPPPVTVKAGFEV